VDHTQPDHGNGIARHVAVKVIKNFPEYRVAAMIELRALKVCELHVCVFSKLRLCPIGFFLVP
jgi:hypothetical protein